MESKKTNRTKLKREKVNKNSIQVRVSNNTLKSWSKIQCFTNGQTYLAIFSLEFNNTQTKGIVSIQ